MNRLALDRSLRVWRRSRSVAGPQFAFDRSVRSYDADGRLRVATALLTRACVSDYRGAEIPDYKALGLDPNRVYSLLRPEDELRKSVQKYCNLPVLSAHIPVSAKDHKPDAVVGATGSNVRFDGTDLTCDLIVWAQDAIEAIEDRSARALSVGYAYTPVMSPGWYRGVRYDGVMTRIEPNHLALCDQGRVAGAIVGDSMPKPLVRRNIKVGFPRTGMTRSSDMRKGLDEGRPDDDYDVTEVFSNLLAYLDGLITPEQMEIVQGLLDGDDLPKESEGNAMDRAVAAQRQAMDRQLSPQRNRYSRVEDEDFKARFPSALLLKRR